MTSCADLEARDVVERYVAGTLGGVETEEFERHLIACSHCQDAVRLGAAVRRELTTAAPVVLLPARRLPVVYAAVTLTLAASIVAIVIPRVGDRGALRSLGNVAAPPPYGGVAVRAAAGAADSLFAEGMRLYGERRYAEARRALADARANGVDSVPTSFFIGVAALMERRAALAIEELAIVTRRGDSPYLAEAHYYAAKAWLRRANADSARVHLAAAGATGAPIAETARTLADSVSEADR